MRQAMVLKRRRTERLARTRQRNLWLAGGSLLVHLLIFLLLPGLAVDFTLHRELLIELVPARAAGAATQSAGATAAAAAQPGASPAAAHPEDAAPARPSERPVEPPSTPQQPAAAQPQPEQASPQANEATSISSAPVTAPLSPEQVTDQPVEREAVPIVDEPVAQPPPEPATPPKPTPAETAPAATSDDAPAQQDGEETDGSAADTPSEEPSPSADGDNDSPDESETTADGGGDSDAGDGPPPGPSAAELRLLGEYGDAARLRIRSQARNPEQGGEGTVTFEFEVAHDGHLIDVRVIRTSGYANLDNDALEATRAAFNERAEKVPFPREVTVASWTFVMSLKYPLY